MYVTKVTGIRHTLSTAQHLCNIEFENQIHSHWWSAHNGKR